MSPSTSSAEFDSFFEKATSRSPFPYQRRLAMDAAWPSRIEIPTGLGKTLAVTVGWSWRRSAESGLRDSTPRRLVYCLPMRVLVEQTRDVAMDVVKRLGTRARVVVLMGGVEDSGDWDIHPEEDAILIGTQDMLLSRALNRGYGMSRYRWPLHFGLLNNDCQWIVDEVQLVGGGVATSAQLQALRRKLGTVLPTRTCWMSATLSENWLRTVDVSDEDLQGHVSLDASDRSDPVVARRIGAKKALVTAKTRTGDARGLSREILAAHMDGTRTLAIVNTVDRARDLFEQLAKAKAKAKTSQELVLLHSRFRAEDRRGALQRAMAAPGPAGIIVVATQVIEAGVDLSSTTLFTESAPWASLVQRFGRCNRTGEDDGARVYWVRLPSEAKQQEKLSRPYLLADMVDAEQTLASVDQVGPASLPKKELGLERGLVLRRRDLFDLFDTTPDLSGSDVDVSRFIREADDLDLRVCWRPIEGDPNAQVPSPSRAELCSVPITVARQWLKDGRAMWTWDALRGRWTGVERVHPGLTLLLRATDGGYDAVYGLMPKSTAPVVPLTAAEPPKEHDRENDGEPESEWKVWYSLSRHSSDVAEEASALSKRLSLPALLAEELTQAGRWHDAGKAHQVWQAAAKRLGTQPPEELVAKSQALRGRIRFEGRPGFRHELASALLALQAGESDLRCFLIASHHGKVRMSLRSLPTEVAPNGKDGDEERLFARGVWDGDPMPEIDLGAGKTIPAQSLSLAPMLLGDGSGRSWLARMLALRDDPELGPFRLGFLEGLIKCADERASRNAVTQAGVR